MAELPSDEVLTDFNDSNLLHLLLPDNEQTWLYCLHESDSNSLIDLSYFLDWNQALNDKCMHVPTEGNTTRGDQINTTFSLQKTQRTPENRRTKLKHPNRKKSSCIEDTSSHEKNTTFINSLPNESAQLNLNSKNEDISLAEVDGIDVVAQLTIDGSPKINAKKSINNSQDTIVINNSNSWNISDRTLLSNISAPKGLMDSTLISNTPLSDFSHFSKLNFIPNSVSTPTKKLICANTDNISITPENNNEPLNKTNTLEDGANDTYSVSLCNEENNDRNNSLNFDVTTTVLTSNAELEKPVEIIEELKLNDALQNTYIHEEPTAEKNSSADNTKIISNNIENLISAQDIINNKLDETQNFTYNSEAHLNSTITIKPKDNEDSEEDSCYSSSSNIRSLGDVCDMSQLQPQKNSNVDCTLTKTRSEDSLCLPEHACSSRKPKKHYGSALNLGTHSINHLTADRRLHQNPNYFLRKPEIQVALPNVSLPEINAKNVSVEKAVVPNRLSRIPRPQSKIPKLVSKK